MPRTHGRNMLKPLRKGSYQDKYRGTDRATNAGELPQI